ncbi:hypothetical protein F4818DRAFT_332652 [Hypoxylon cercidicola]|nr:hypothetical protein F4818DRAFT_332652 [Hypoxylon cercidicola]
MAGTPPTSVLLTGGTIIVCTEDADSLDVIRDGAVLVTGDRIAGIYDTAHPNHPPAGTEVIDCTNKIITPGFIDTHRHGWQTGLKTLASNTTMPDYMNRYAFGSATLYTAEDVYIGQLAGLLEALNAGVTASLDHAHHIWSKEITKAGLQASIDSGARVYWNHAFNGTPTYPFSEQVANFKEMARTMSKPDNLTIMGVAYDGWTYAPAEEIQELVATMG